MDPFLQWFQSLDWSRFLPELLGKFIGFLFGFAASWFLLFRKRLKALERLKQGDTDDVLFQMHCLPDSSDGKKVLLIRNVAPHTTLSKLYDNPSAQKLVRDLADKTTLANPILETQGSEGFEVLNDAFGYIAGYLATSPFPRETWLFAMTCEDRVVVRKKSIRCFLIRPSDLSLFENWKWCSQSVMLEKPWHWFRIVALHRIAKVWAEEKLRPDADATAMPLVNEQEKHNRMREISLGLNLAEPPVSPPVDVSWASHIDALRDLGLQLESDSELISIQRRE